MQEVSALAKSESEVLFQNLRSSVPKSEVLRSIPDNAKRILWHDQILGSSVQSPTSRFLPWAKTRILRSSVHSLAMEEIAANAMDGKTRI
jgi:hypothetical protein